MTVTFSTLKYKKLKQNWRAKTKLLFVYLAFVQSYPVLYRFVTNKAEHNI